ncbi:MAG: peptidylprolyl isomerase [Phycisphaerae bacterium]
MPEAKSGDQVSVHYTGKLTDGTVFDSSEGREPLDFTLGQGQVIPGFEQAITGMNTGEKKTVTIPSDQAYGPRREDMVVEVEKEQFPDDVDPEIGQRFQIGADGGQNFTAQVTAVNDNTVTLDANSPLAGQDLVFEIELVDINS